MSSGNDIQGQVTLNSNPAVQAVGQVEKAMDRLGATTRKANKEAQDLQARVSKGFKQSGESIAKAGGPLGSVGGRLLGGIGLGGPLGIAAAGLAALTTAATALTAASDRAVAQITRVVEAEDKLQAARDKGQKDIEAQATAGLGQEGILRKLLAAGGGRAAGYLGELEKGGVSTADAAPALMEIMKRLPQQFAEGSPQIDRILRFGKNLSSLGLGFGESITGLLQGGGFGNEETMQRRAERLYKQSSGLRGDPSKLYYDAISNTRSSQYLTDAETYRERIGGIAGIARGRSGQLPGMASDAAAAAADPVSKAIVETNIAMSKLLMLMERQAAAENPVVAYLKTAGRAYGLSAGSATQLLDDQITANSDAIFKPDR